MSRSCRWRSHLLLTFHQCPRHKFQALYHLWGDRGCRKSQNCDLILFLHRSSTQNLVTLSSFHASNEPLLMQLQGLDWRVENFTICWWKPRIPASNQGQSRALKPKISSGPTLTHHLFAFSLFTLTFEPEKKYFHQVFRGLLEVWATRGAHNGKVNFRSDPSSLSFPFCQPTLSRRSV